MQVKRPVCLVCLCFLAALYLLELMIPPWRHAEEIANRVENGTQLTVEATLQKLEHKNFSTVLTLNDISLSAESYRLFQSKVHNETPPEFYGLLAYLKDPADAKILRIGNRLLLSGSFAAFEEAYNEGNFNALHYYSMRRIDGRLKKAEILRVSESFRPLADLLFRLRERTARVFSTYLDDRNAGTLSALVLGDKTGLDEEVREDYQNAGISHILSLSGLHIATTGLLLFGFLRKRGLPGLASTLLSGGIIFLYSMLTGFSTSTVRALIMYLMGIAAQSLKRSYDLLSSASLSALLILLMNPGYLYDNGFLLSFAAVSGIGLLHPVLADMWAVFAVRSGLSGLHNHENRLTGALRKTGETLLFSLSIQLATLPVTEYSFFQLPIYGIFLNLLVIPLLSGLLAAGFCLGFAGNIVMSPADENILHMLLKQIAVISAKIAHGILTFYDALTDMTKKLGNQSLICGRPSRAQIALYLFLMAAAVLLHAVLEKEKKEADSLQTTAVARRCRKRSVSLCRFLFVLFFAAVCILSYRRKETLELHMLAVGQGDCTLICGKNTPVILIDGGASDIRNTGRYRILPCLKAHGIGKIDYIFISHFDADHVNGLIELLENPDNGIDFERVVISGVVPRLSEEGNYPAFLEAVQKRRESGADISVFLMDAGEEIREGSMTIRCLGPDVREEDIWRNRDLNDNSLILHIEEISSGFSALFTGDMSQSVEEEQLEKLRNGNAACRVLSQPVTLLKTAHHGSKTGSSEAFLQKLHPKISTISCGIDNQYGHPHAETLQNLSNVPGNHIYITSECGEITVTASKDRVIVRTWLADN